MKASLGRAVVFLVANAIGLWVASVVLEDLVLGWRTFVLAVLIFSVIEVLVQPVIGRAVRPKAEAFEGVAVLLSTFVGLLVSSLVSDGIKITGVSTWLLATVIVWLVAVVAGVVLPAIVGHRRGASHADG